MFIAFEKFVLDNGLQVILHRDESLPIVAVNVWYHVGSKDEEEGKTGFAHLFEHIMFEGSKHHDRSFFEPLQKVGAVLNGSTTTDRTNYWEDVPANYLELALWLESDRMGFLLEALDQRRFDIQRDVVKNERRQNYENRPYGLAHAYIQPALFPKPHPYNWLTIGSPEDLDAATLEDAKAFFQRFYSPSNASLAIVGHFDPDRVRPMVERYFGDIPPGPPRPRVQRMDSALRGQVHLTMEDRVRLPRLYLAWPTGPAFSEDEAPLDLLAVVLGDGKSSRLHRRLVYEMRLARDVRVGLYAMEIAGEFHVQVTANDGVPLERVLEVVEEELDRARREPPDEGEMERARNRIQSHHLRQLERFGGFGGRADQLNYFNVFAGDPGRINQDLDRYLKVSPEAVRDTAARRLGHDRVRLDVLPQRELKAMVTGVDRAKAPTAGADPRFTPPLPRRGRLDNGLEVLVVPRKGVPLVSFGLLVDAGALTDPPERPGLAHMTASMLHEGTAYRTSRQIAEEMESLGSYISTEAGHEFVFLSAQVLASRWRQALELMADVARNPIFPDEELERVRQERLTDLKRVADNPMAVAGRVCRAVLFGPGTPYGHPTTGTEGVVSSLGRHELAAHFQAHYRPDRATLIVVGDMDEDRATAMARELLGDWTADGAAADHGPREGSAPLPHDGPTTIYLVDKPGAPQSVIRVGQLTVPRHHPDFYALTLVNYIFGGQFSARLNMNLRQDKGYSYGYMSSIEWLRGPSALVAGGAVQTAATRAAIEETLREFADIRGARPISAEEFEDARAGILRGLPTHFETQGQVLHQWARAVNFRLPDDYFATYPDRIGAVTLEEVRRAAHEHLTDQGLRIVVVGDRSAIEEDLRRLGYPVVPVDEEGRPLEGEPPTG